MQVTHDKKLLIAIGRSRKAAQWQNREMLWSEFLDKLANTTRTRETRISRFSIRTRCSPLMPTGRTPPSGPLPSRWRRRCAARSPSRKTR